MIRAALREWLRRGLARVSPNGEYHKLSREDQAYVDILVDHARERGIRQDLIHSDGTELYAYPSGGGRISWGKNDRYGSNIARGVFEAEREAAS